MLLKLDNILDRQDDDIKVMIEIKDEIKDLIEYFNNMSLIIRTKIDTFSKSQLKTLDLMLIESLRVQLWCNIDDKINDLQAYKPYIL